MNHDQGRYPLQKRSLKSENNLYFFNFQVKFYEKHFFVAECQEKSRNCQKEQRVKVHSRRT